MFLIPLLLLTGGILLFGFFLLHQLNPAAAYALQVQPWLTEDERGAFEAFKLALAKQARLAQDATTLPAWRPIGAGMATCRDLLQQFKRPFRQLAVITRNQVHTHMALVAMHACRMSSAVSPPSDVPADVVSALSDAADGLSVFVEGSRLILGDGGVELPPGLMDAWSAAAAPVVAHLATVHSWQHARQHAAAAPSPQEQQVLKLVGALLQLWHAAAVNTPSTELVEAWPVLDSLPVAAELATLLLTSPAAAAAAATSHQAFDALCVQGPLVLHQLAVLFNTANAQAAHVATNEAKAASIPPELVADSVQRALVLHLAVTAAFYRQQRLHGAGEGAGASATSGTTTGVSAGSSSRKRGTATRWWLKHLGFPRGAVQAYGDALVAVTSLPAGSSSGATEAGHKLMHGASSALRSALLCRNTALRVPNWPQRFEDVMEAAGAPGAAEVLLPYNVCLLAPRIEGVQLQLLVLDFISLCNCGERDLAGLLNALQLLSRRLQDVPPRPASAGAGAACGSAASESCAAAAATVLQHLWLGLGRDLLRAGGVAAADVDEGRHRDGTGGGTNSSEGAAAAAPEAEAGADGMAEYESIMNDIMGIELPDAPAAQLKVLWEEYAPALLHAFSYYAECHPDARFAYHMHERTPLLSSRVIEGATRAVGGLQDLSAGPHLNALQVLALSEGVYLASEASAPERMCPPRLFRCTSLAARMCSQLVSGLKQIRAAEGCVEPEMPAELVHALLRRRLQIANNSAIAGAVVGEFAMTHSLPAQWRERRSGGGGPPDEAPFASPEALLASPCLGAWLGLTGRSLVDVGRLLAQTPPWIRAIDGHEAFAQTMMVLTLFAGALEWLSEMLPRLLAAQTQPGPAPLPPAARLADRASLLQLQQTVVPLCEAAVALRHACDIGTFSGEPGAQAAAQQLVLAAIAADGLPARVQVLGAAVWAAFPARYACNDPACTSLEGLSESSFASKVCKGCKAASYCCSEHQLRHYPAHKAACKHLKQLLQPAAQ